MIVMIAPFAVVFGPIAHDEEDPPSLVPEVLFTAFLMSAAVTLLSSAIRILKSRK